MIIWQVLSDFMIKFIKIPSQHAMTHSHTTKSPIHWFRHSLPYINTHRGKSFVVMISSEAIAHDNFATLVQDLALLHSLGIRLVLVHGARVQINDALSQAGLSDDAPFYHGVRVTPPAIMPTILAVVGGLSLKIQGEFSKGLANTPLFGAKISTITGNFVSAKPFGVRCGVDFMQTGEVRRIDTKAIKHSLDNHHIVIINSIGFSVTGDLFNLDAMSVATHVAVSLVADKLIILDKSLTDTHGTLIKEMTTEKAQQLIPTSKLAPTLTHAIHTCKHGVGRVQLINFDKDDALLGELFTTDGHGTMISQNDYDHIRQATALDIIGIMAIIQPLEEQGILVARSRERLEETIDEFSVMERDGKIIGCIAIHELDESSVEIASVAMHDDYRSGERGTKLLIFAEQYAKRMGKSYLFALTTRTLHWFIKHGFSETHAHDLPQKRFKQWKNGRNSKVLIKRI